MFCKFIILLIIALPLTLLSQNDDWMEKYKKEYWLSVIPNRAYMDDYDFIHVFVTADKEASVRLKVMPSLYDSTKTVVPGKVTIFYLYAYECDGYHWDGYSVEKPDTVFRALGMHLTSDEEINVVVSSNYSGINECYRALSIPELGTEYIISSWGDQTYWSTWSEYLSFPSYIAIVGTEQETNVTFTLGGNDSTMTPSGIKPGESMSETLRPADVWLISSKGNGADLSGSKIVSDKPVAVISGNMLAKIPTVGGRTNNFNIDMELPTKLWGKEYIAFTCYHRIEVPYVRIYAKEPNTKVYKNGEYFGTIASSGGVIGKGFLQTRVNTDTNRSVVFTSDKPISITHYSSSMSYHERDELGLSPKSTCQTHLVPSKNFVRSIRLPMRLELGISDDTDFHVVFEMQDGEIPDDITFQPTDRETGLKTKYNLKDLFHDSLFTELMSPITNKKYGVASVRYPDIWWVGEMLIKSENTLFMVYPMYNSDLNRCYPGNEDYWMDLVSVEEQKENSEATNVKIYPNPAEDEIFVEIELKRSSAVTFSMKDLLGRELETIEYATLSTGKHRQNFNTNELGAGIYILNIKFNNTETTHKFVVID